MTAVDDPNETPPMESLLTDFVVGNYELERLEDLLDNVNFFEASGATRSELRHSDFLAYLLSPHGNHGLGEVFLKRFLQASLLNVFNNEDSISALEIDVWDLSDSYVLREHENIDLLIVNESHGFVVVVENKIGTSEHSDQLARYKARAKHLFSGYRTLFLYLTIDGEAPSDTDYLAITYDSVAWIVQNILKHRSHAINSEISLLLQHYVDLIRRHFMDQSELSVLARQIYDRHRSALDFIFEHRPDLQGGVRKTLEKLIDENDQIVRDHCTKAYVRFAPVAWDPWNIEFGGDGQFSSNRLIWFEFQNSPERLQLVIILGLGNFDERQSVYDFARRSESVFPKCSKTNYPQYTQLWKLPILTKAKLSNAYDIEDLWGDIHQKWRHFLEKDFNPLTEAIQNEFC